ncbi:Uncharacterised protein [Mycobacteroides abscessus subsp. abscessus]|nr:Uncharacterised protein [Mycobacteroides abscessus subsp. abscessus]
MVGRPSASTTSTVRAGVPQTASSASSVPSPPSAKGSCVIRALGKAWAAPRASAAAAAGAPAEPLKESGAQTMTGASSLMSTFNLTVPLDTTGALAFIIRKNISESDDFPGATAGVIAAVGGFDIAVRPGPHSRQRMEECFRDAKRGRCGPDRIRSAAGG